MEEEAVVSTVDPLPRTSIGESLDLEFINVAFCALRSFENEGGGVTFVQDENSARFFGMPSTAIQTGCVDFILAAWGDCAGANTR